MSTRLSLGAAFLLGTSTLAATAMIPTLAMAQATSSSINGVVQTDDGAAVAGATVTIIHTPTGRVDRATTSENGTFFETGLAVGGPYTVTVESAAGNLLRENVRLSPSSNSLQLTIATIDEMIVTGTRSVGQDIGDGVGSVFSDDEILGQPSVNRDLVATLVRDPLANSSGEGILSVAGSNPRFNALAIDGSLQQDDFGLSNSTYPTGRAPISLDVIESASVAATDYSVTQSGFTGGLVNVVTKSGTNELDGSLYFYKQNEDFIGDTAFGDVDVPVAAFDEEEYGFVLRGPIVKDKLFFLVSYDEFKTGSGREFSVQDQNNGVDPRLFTELASIVQNTYGFDIGERPNSIALPESSERFLAKLDWNINDQHRASFTYQDTQESGFAGVGGLNFSSAYYTTPQDLKAYTGQLFSDWSDRFSTEVRVNFKENNRLQSCQAGDRVGEFEFRLAENDLVGTALAGLIDDGDGQVDTRPITIRGGCDVFRQGNTFDDERLQVQAIGRLTGGDHLLTFGGEYQNYELANLFGQFSAGRFTFNSVDDILNQRANVLAALPQSGNRDDILAAWGYDQWAFFIQDSWQATPNFRVDAGIRYERISQSDTPVARDFFQQTYGFSNNQNLDGNDLFMPRFSFEWNVFDRTTLTGGFGLFGGGDPKVWTSNAFTPATFFTFAGGVNGVNPATGVPQQILDRVAQNDPNDPSFLDFISPDFETPADWKYSLRLDQSFDLDFGGIDLGDDFLFSAQALYTETQNGFRWFNLAQTANPAALPTGVAPDGRPIYADLDDARIANAVGLTNTELGDSLVLTASLSKDWDNGIGAFFSYAYQDVNTVAPGTSSRGVSNLEGTVDFDVNNPQLGRSNFELEHAFKIGLSYETDVLAGLESRFSLFGQITSGSPFAYTFNTDRDNALFGRQGGERTPFDADLLYVPTLSGGAIADSAVVVGSGFDEAAFVNFVTERGLPQGIQERFSDTSNWNQRWDFQWQQEIPFFNKQAEKFVGDNKLNFVVDIFNVANLIDSDWGTQFNGPGNGQAPAVIADLVSAADVAANGVDGATALEGDAPRTACVSAGSCVYRFNQFEENRVDTSNRSLFRSLYEIRVGLRYEF